MLLKSYTLILKNLVLKINLSKKMISPIEKEIMSLKKILKLWRRKNISFEKEK